MTVQPTAPVIEDKKLSLLIESNLCPDCGNYGFLDGPRGGMAINIFCANPGCRSGFNVTPLKGLVVFIQRIDKGGEQLYPPKVHALVETRYALCRFTSLALAAWPRGHGGVPADELDRVTCPVCKRMAQHGDPT